MGQFGAGQALRRVEELRLLTGQGRSTDDIRLEGAGEAIGASSAANDAAAGRAP